MSTYVVWQHWLFLACFSALTKYHSISFLERPATGTWIAILGYSGTLGTWIQVIAVLGYSDDMLANLH